MIKYLFEVAREGRRGMSYVMVTVYDTNLAAAQTQVQKQFPNATTIVLESQVNEQAHESSSSFPSRSAFNQKNGPAVVR